MARPEKQGLDYFPLDADIFSADARLRVLMNKFGSEGFSVYMYILCKCYGDRGYYIEARNEFYELAACDLGLAEARIRAVVEFLAQKGLLDAALLRRGYLSSHGIQMRFQEAIHQRMSRRKRSLHVDGSIWLLRPEETRDYIDPGTADLSADKPHKEKERKEKESKEEERKTNEPAPQAAAPSPTAYGSFANVCLSAQELRTLQERFPDWEQRIERLSAYMASSGKVYGNHFATLVSWAQEDAKKPPTASARPFKGLQPPPGDFRQPVAANPGAFELEAIRRLQERSRAREGA